MRGGSTSAGKQPATLEKNYTLSSLFLEEFNKDLNNVLKKTFQKQLFTN